MIIAIRKKNKKKKETSKQDNRSYYTYYENKELNKKVQELNNDFRKSEKEVNSLKEKLFIAKYENKLLKQTNDKLALENANLKKQIEEIKQNKSSVQIQLKPESKIEEQSISRKKTILDYIDDENETGYKKPTIKSNNKYTDYRKINSANYRCDDGHYVRSKSERDIDNFFFNNNILHIYESKYIDPITNKEYIPDFYLPKYNLYIEYFGLNSPEYNRKREEKIEAYKRNQAINFDCLDYTDDFNITEKLQYICQKHNIPYNR